MSQLEEVSAVKSLPLLLSILIFIGGCGHAEPVHSGETGFLTIIAGDEVTIGDKRYKIRKQTKIQDSNGETLNRRDLQIGMKVQAFFKGEMEDRLLAEKEAVLLRIEADEDGERESEMVADVLEQLKENKNQNFIITNVESEENSGIYTMDVMRRSNLDIGYTITVDAITYEILYSTYRTE